ncbi:MAG: MraY family glycosyltransferase [Patescibacteria group bacterium]
MNLIIGNDRSAILIATCAIAVLSAFLSYFLSFGSSRLAKKFGAMDAPSSERKIHKHPIPLWGGLGIGLTILFFGMVIIFILPMADKNLSFNQLAGFFVGILILLLGGLLDDRFPQKPWVQILFPISAALVVILSGTGIIQVTNPAGHGGFSLVWWRGFGLSLPSDFITFAWLILATYSTKILDGLDGLVTGLTVIGAGLVGALSLSATYFLPSVALFSGLTGGAFLGFLPHNINPAKQFLGESGATIAGFCLGVLAILSGAKIAIALAVLAIPIADVVLVVLGRIRRGVPWYRGDDSHLHFRLLKAGLPHRIVVLLLWCISLFAGILALSLQTRGKIFLVVGLVILAAVTSYFAGIKSKTSIKP